MAKSSTQVHSVSRKARNVGIGSLTAMTPFIFDIVGPLIAGKIRDGLSHGSMDAVKDWFSSGKKITLADLQKGLDLLPPEERAKIEASMVDLQEQINLIQHSTLSDADKKKRIESISKMYFSTLPTGGSEAHPAFPKPEASLSESLASWSPQIHELQREWFNLISEKHRNTYLEHMAHLAPLLAIELQPFVPEKDTQKRASQLSDIEGALKGRALEQYKLWYRALDSAGRKHLSNLAKSRRLTTKIIERVLDLADVPAPKIPDFESYLDENKIRKSHDEFIRCLSPDSRLQFRDFRDRLHPTVLKDKLSGVRWTPEVARDVYVELANIAGSMAAFNRAEATMVLDMVEDRQLEAPAPDDAKPSLDADSAETIFQLIQSAKPKPKPTVGEVLSDGFKKFKDVMGQVDNAVKDLFPYENLDLPDFKSKDETPTEYVERVIAEGKVDELREESESLQSITESKKISARNDAFAKRLLADDKFMSKVNAKVNEFIRNWKLGKIKDRK